MFLSKGGGRTLLRKSKEKLKKPQGERTPLQKKGELQEKNSVIRASPGGESKGSVKKPTRA